MASNVTVVNNNLIVGSQAVVAGRYYFEVLDATTTTNANTTYLTKITLTQTFEAGRYLIYAYAELSSGTAARNSEVIITVDGTTIVDGQIYHGIVNTFASYSAVDSYTLTAASHTILLQWRRGTTAATISIKNAQIMIYRIT
jgi:hypothetical protein